MDYRDMDALRSEIDSLTLSLAASKELTENLKLSAKNVTSSTLSNEELKRATAKVHDLERELSRVEEQFAAEAVYAKKSKGELETKLVEVEIKLQQPQESDAQAAESIQTSNGSAVREAERRSSAYF
jgi:hypothetical protein